MGFTFAQKALAAASGRQSVQTREIVEAAPDLALSHDNTAAIARIFDQLNLDRVRFPERLAVALDHAVPAPTAAHAANHAEARRFAEQQQIGYFSETGRGVCHQVLCEDGLIRPGMLVLGADSHSTHYGALGAFGAGIGRSEMAALWATGEIWLRVPESIDLHLEGRLDEGISAKDLALTILARLGAAGAIYRSIEFSGAGVGTLSIAGRMVLANMMAETGAKNAFLPPDEHTLAWLAPRTTQPFAALLPDPQAVYLERHVFDLSKIEHMLAAPHSPDAAQPLRQLAGKPVQQAFLGTCTNGRLEDLAEAAAVLAGRRVAPGTRLLVVPASAAVLRAALDQGVIETLLSAGAMLGVPGCGPCMGVQGGVLAPGEVCISSANRNFRGRMGEVEAEIYLGSPRVVAASAAAGMLCAPEDL